MGFSDIIKLILASLPFFLIALLLSKKVNLKKPYRGHQFLSVPLSLIYSIVAIVKYEDLENKLIELVNKLIDKIEETVNAGSVSESITGVLQKISEFLKGVNWQLYMIFIANLLLLLIFYILKAILLPILKKIWSNKDIYDFTSGHFYEWNDGLSTYCLKNNYYITKKLMKIYFIIACFAGSLLLTLYKAYSNWPGFMAVMYPFAIVVLVGEVYYFLDGKTAAEYEDNFSGEDGYSSRQALYYPFSNQLKILFGDRLIFGRVKFPNYRKSNNSNVLKRLEGIDNQEAMVANRFFYKKATTRKKVDTDDMESKYNQSIRNDKDAKGIDLDEALVSATYRLMNGESIMFATPFYHDYSDYVFLPLNRALTKSRKVLVIVGRTGIEEDVKSWLTDSFEKVVNVPEMWNIQYLDNENCFDGDVAIVTAAQVFDETIVKVNKDFIKNVTEVVLIEPSQFVSTAQVSISVFISNLGDKSTFYIFDRNSDRDLF